MKKRVAICMIGAVSKSGEAFININELYRKGEYVDYEKCKRSIDKYIINRNLDYDFDFFCHSWNIDLNNDLDKLYKPRLIHCEDNSKYNDEILNKIKNGGIFSAVSQALSLKKSIELKEQYEKENNINYDIIISYRYDILLWKEIKLENYDLNDNKIYVNGGNNNTNGDFHFIMNNFNSKLFKELYNSTSKNNIPKQHYWIKNYIVTHLHKKLLCDNIKPGKHQEVIRKIKEFSIDKKYLTQSLYDSI